MISVVVPVLNGESTLGRCLSALAVAMPAGSELVVVDDGSTDHTGAIAAEHGARVLVHPVNRGTSAARNTGWRGAQGEVIVFVDADVEVAPDAIQRLLALLQDPALLGANGVLSPAEVEGTGSDFANLCIYYQHRRHGPRVASAFTSICALRRSTLEQMGGWNERWFSRYADDVETRFHLPAGSIGVDFDAHGRHHKHVPVRGVLKHRFQIGSFYARSALSHRTEIASRPATAVIDTRYPLNTLAAGGICLAVVAMPLAPAVGAAGGSVCVLGFLVVNRDFARFVAARRGRRTAALWLGITLAESFAMGFGMVAGTASAVIRAREPASGAPATPTTV